MTNLRVYWKQLGGHVHCRVFSGRDALLTHGKNGDLVFDEREWNGPNGVFEKLVRIAQVLPESTPETDDVQEGAR